MQTLILGRTGSGKTYRASKLIQDYNGYVIFVDANYNFHGIEQLKDLKFKSKITYFNCDYSNNDFDLFVDYLFDMYFNNKYNHRMLIVIDEADLFCRTNPESMERLATKSRRFFDCAYISQRPSLLRTTNGYVIFTQVDKLILFSMRDIDYNVIQKYSEWQITEDMREFLRNKYYYIVFDANNVIGCNSKGQEVKTWNI